MRYERLLPHEDGRRLLLRVPSKKPGKFHRDARDIVAFRVSDDGEVDAAILGDDGYLIAAGDLEAHGIEIVRVLDRGDETMWERVRRIGRKGAGAVIGAVT